LAAAGLVVGFALVPWSDVRRHWALFVPLVGLLLLTLLQLVPLPPEVYSRLGGHQLAVDVLDLIDESDVWKPLSIAPFRNWNAVFALLLPLAVLVLSCGADDRTQSLLVKVLLALGLVSALLGILQVISEPGGILYLYRVTNENDAVGLFANRNHQAFFLACLFPLLSFVAAPEGVEPGRALLQRNLAILVGIALLPLILITGSRGGLALTLIGMAAALFLYRSPSSLKGTRRRAARINMRYVVYGGALFLIAALAFLMTRSNSLERLFIDETNVTSRSEFWPYMGQIIRDFLPFGSGNGSFVEAYEIYEPDRLLNPRYLNHAHNDFIEIAVTAGVPGVVLVASAVFLWSWAAFRVFRMPRHKTLVLPRISAVVTGMLIVASVGDYPLRTPSLAAFFAFMSVVLYRGARYGERGMQRSAAVSV
jgi:O-antigen ligase